MDNERIKDIMKDENIERLEVVKVTFESGKRCFIFHKWFKWTPWDNSPFILIRKCARCGLIQFTRSKGV